MSEWISSKEKDGTKVTILVDLLPFTFFGTMIVSALFVIFLVSYPMTYYFITLAAATIGFLLFLSSKISVYKKGRLLSFGTKEMRPLFKYFYYIGYALILLSSFGFILLIVINSQNR